MILKHLLASESRTKAYIDERLSTRGHVHFSTSAKDLLRGDTRFAVLVWMAWRHGIDLTRGIVALCADGDENVVLSVPTLVKMLRAAGHTICQDDIHHFFSVLAVGCTLSDHAVKVRVTMLSRFFGLRELKDVGKRSLSTRFLTLRFTDLADLACDVFSHHDAVVESLARFSGQHLLENIRQFHTPFLTKAALKKMGGNIPLHAFGERWCGDRSGVNAVYRKIFSVNCAHGMFPPDVLTDVRHVLNATDDFVVDYQGMARMPARAEPE